jgi:hypothetical protein
MKKVIEIEIDISEQELLNEFIINIPKYDMFKIADKALSEVSWHNNMPKSMKLEYINMLQKHIDIFNKDLNRNLK